ncbi:MAG: MBL fold metallo-hydrolase [Spirochaetota bacterium]
MARSELRRAENVAGDFYVDTSCIDCGTCRWMAKDIFSRSGGMSNVYKQPENEMDKLRAMQALIACPTFSIGQESKNRSLREKGEESFPNPVGENVYHMGYHSEKSFGAASYLITREDGNIMVDSPRFSKKLADKLHSLGGIKWLFLTHRDDVADHEKFREEFSCTRILCETDAKPSTNSIEILFNESNIPQLGEDIEIITVPGHTQGHSVLNYNKQYLFTGDHLAYSPSLANLYAFRTACWYSWPEQITSMQKLQHYQFTAVLPGHGHPLQANSVQEMQQQLEKCIQWMQEKS